MAPRTPETDDQQTAGQQPAEQQQPQQQAPEPTVEVIDRPEDVLTDDALEHIHAATSQPTEQPQEQQGPGGQLPEVPPTATEQTQRITQRPDGKWVLDGKYVGDSIEEAALKASEAAKEHQAAFTREAQLRATGAEEEVDDEEFEEYLAREAAAMGYVKPGDVQQGVSPLERIQARKHIGAILRDPATSTDDFHAAADLALHVGDGPMLKKVLETWGQEDTRAVLKYEQGLEQMVQQWAAQAEQAEAMQQQQTLDQGQTSKDEAWDKARATYAELNPDWQQIDQGARAYLQANARLFHLAKESGDSEALLEVMQAAAVYGRQVAMQAGTYQPVQAPPQQQPVQPSMGFQQGVPIQQQQPQMYPQQLPGYAPVPQQQFAPAAAMQQPGTFVPGGQQFAAPIDSYDPQAMLAAGGYGQQQAQQLAAYQTDELKLAAQLEGGGASDVAVNTQGSAPQAAAAQIMAGLGRAIGGGHEGSGFAG